MQKRNHPNSDFDLDSQFQSFNQILQEKDLIPYIFGQVFNGFSNNQILFLRDFLDKNLIVSMAIAYSNIPLEDLELRTRLLATMIPESINLSSPDANKKIKEYFNKHFEKATRLLPAIGKWNKQGSYHKWLRYHWEQFGMVFNADLIRKNDLHGKISNPNWQGKSLRAIRNLLITTKKPYKENGATVYESIYRYPFYSDITQRLIVYPDLDILESRIHVTDQKEVERWTRDGIDWLVDTIKLLDNESPLKKTLLIDEIWKKEKPLTHLVIFDFPNGEIIKLNLSLFKRLREHLDRLYDLLGKKLDPVLKVNANIVEQGTSRKLEYSQQFYFQILDNFENTFQDTLEKMDGADAYVLQWMFNELPHFRLEFIEQLVGFSLVSLKSAKYPWGKQESTDVKNLVKGSRGNIVYESFIKNELKPRHRKNIASITTDEGIIDTGVAYDMDDQELPEKIKITRDNWEREAINQEDNSRRQSISRLIIKGMLSHKDKKDESDYSNNCAIVFKSKLDTESKAILYNYAGILTPTQMKIVIGLCNRERYREIGDSFLPKKSKQAVYKIIKEFRKNAPKTLLKELSSMLPQFKKHI